MAARFSSFAFFLGGPMKRTRMRFASFILGLLFVTTHLLGQTGIALPNWTVPPYTAQHSSGGINAMTDATPPRVFVGVQPFRLADMRTTTMPNFLAGYAPPAFSQGAPRSFGLNSDPEIDRKSVV